MTTGATRTCTKCKQTLAIQLFSGKRAVCISCVEAQRARAIERKDTVAYSDALAERIVDLLAAGGTVAEVAEQSWGPTPRQLQAWRRGNVDFDTACQEAERLSAAAHLDKAKEALRQAEAGKLPVSDAKSLAETHLKLASTLNPRRYGSHAIDVTSSDGSLRPAVTIMAAFDALLALLPPAPARLVVDVTPRRVPADDAELLPAPASAAGTAPSDDDPYAEDGESLPPIEQTARAA